MKKMQIFEPSMCCSTGLCGVGVDPELLRISTAINTLKNNGIIVDRFNLSSFPMEFINNKVINILINEEGGVESLPATLLDGEVILTGRYPTNEELASCFDISRDLLRNKPRMIKGKPSIRKTGGCDCSDGKC